MSDIIRRLLKILAYLSAAVVVLLAVLLGLFRLFLPRLPEYQEELKAWASEAIGMQVEFAGMDARWGLRGPELNIYDAELIRPATGVRVVAAREVGIVVALPELLFEQALVVDTVRISDSTMELRETAEGAWLLQGQPVQELLETKRRIDDVTLVGTGINLLLLRAGDQRPTRFELRRVDVQRDLQRTAVDADVRLPAELGTSLAVSATQLAASGEGTQPWNVTVNADDLLLNGWSALYRDPRRRVTNGSGGIDVSFALAGTGVRNVSAAIRLQAVSLNGGPSFDVAGRVAWNSEPDRWLMALDELQVSTPNGAWPLSAFRLEADGALSQDVRSLEIRAAHVDFADVGIVAPWLPEAARSWIDEWRPDGVVRNLVATISELDTDLPAFAVAAELERAGLAAQGDLPGIRGFSGSLRADRDGGLVAIDAHAVSLDLEAWVPEAVEFDRVSGTVVWRRSGPRTTILSDNIELTSAVLESRSSVELNIEGDGPPEVDLSSSFSIADIATAKRFIPRRVMSDKLHQWFQDALLSGRISRGALVLRGPLEAFPFDNGEGELLVEGDVEDLEFRYHPRFPVVSVASMAVTLDETHLYTRENRALTAGTTSIDAEVSIPDLREPVLRIDADATGTLASLHAFAAASPLAGIFGGHLDKVAVDGPATVALDLTLPVRNWREFAVTARITSTAGSLQVAGLDAPFTELAGTVTVERDHISSEALTGRFLGAPVDIELRDAGADRPAYRVVAAAQGAATAAALVDELGLPLRDALAGAADFDARVLFPRADYEPRAPLLIEVESDLAGLAVRLPAPFSKPGDERREFTGTLRFEPGGERIAARGSAGDELSWDLAFARVEHAWDFDRGMVTLGGVAGLEPDVRGLHIRGTVAELRVAEWLALGKGEGLEAGAGERIRSIDLQADELWFIGQRLVDHRLQVDRSARDWLVQLEGDDVAGSMFVPYDFSAANTLVLDMERLILPGDGDTGNPADVVTNGSPPTRLDPRALPSISLRTAEFGLGERRFGKVEAEFRHQGNGLVADPIVATDPTFRIEGSASWRADASDPMGSRSDMRATLTSTDVEETMRRLGYQPGLAGEDMRIDLDMHWSGGPHGEFLRTLDGRVEVELGTGQLNEIEPGAGRVFGLMSIVALPRRLSLDFRDVFQKGFGFDSISGSFRLDDGAAYTCDLSLVGPAADIGVTGRTDLVAGNYSQAAVVSASLGNTLPVVGAIAAGPQVAAALFLFSQIFKKPLREVGQIYYSMSGPWDSPEVESTDAEEFANIAAQAGCLADAETD